MSYASRGRRSIPRRLVPGMLAATLILSTTTLAFSQSRGERRSERTPDPGAPAGSVHESPVLVVDGAPRPPSPRSHPAVRLVGRDASVPGPRDRVLESLSTVTDEAGMEVPLGGDDVVVGRFPVILNAYLDVATSGTIFVAVSTYTQVHVYRSLDGGDTWTLWSTFQDPGAINPLVGDFDVAEGVANRAFISYSSDRGTGADQVRVAYADINAASPSWTIQTVVLAAAPVNYTQVDIDTDDGAFDDYYVYLVARGADGNGDDLWFARSTTQGNAYSAGYKVIDNTGGPGTWAGNPLVRYGFGDWIHLSYLQGATGTDSGLFQRRAPLWASGGLGAWEAAKVLDSLGNGEWPWNAALEPSPADGNVFLVFWWTNLSGLSLRYSTDSGATWPGGNQGTLPVGREYDQPFTMLPGGGLAIMGPNDLGGHPPLEMQISRSTTAAPLVWSTPQSTTRHFWSGYQESAIASDPTRSNRLAAIWLYEDDTDYVVRFDAEWRRDPGYPNTDIGFPISVQGGGQTPPAVAEVDGDPEKEIVFATVAGDIHVVNHDGTPVPGWPVNIGAIPFDAPVAVGDLVGNGVPYVVSGNASGKVYAFRPDGTIVPGWPVTMNEVDDVYVSIGALGPPFTRYVVAVCGHEIRPIPYTGELLSTGWGTFTDRISRPAAIGDIDNDGVTEVVTLKGSYYHAMALGLAGPKEFRWFSGETFSDAPTLADIDNNGTLEIAAPTASGKMYLLNADGTNFSAAWPITVSPGVPLTAAALADFLGPFEVEMAFAEATGAVHVRWDDGTEGFSYPKVSGSAALYMPPILSRVNAISSNVNIGTTDAVNGTARSWRNLGSVPAGWPKNLPGPVEETFASGDIDNDGRNELVVLGVGFLTVLDVGTPPATDPWRHWPMYGYDAQRTGCLACTEIMTAAGDTPGAAYRTALDVRPNPFNPSTTIEYEVARAGAVSLAIFDVAGRRVATLIDGEHRGAGRYSVSYTAQTASGVYFARLTMPDGEITRKIVLLK